MKSFIKWLVVTTTFHLSLLLIGIIATIVLKDMVGVTVFVFILCVLIIGKYKYYRKNKDYIDEKYR